MNTYTSTLIRGKNVTHRVLQSMNVFQATKMACALKYTGSTTCAVKSSLVKPEQMTGSYELCMLIDGVVRRYPTAVAELDTPLQRNNESTLYADTRAGYNHW